VSMRLPSERKVLFRLLTLAAIATAWAVASAGPASQQRQAESTPTTKSLPAAVEITKAPGLPVLHVEATDKAPPKPSTYWTPEWLTALATAILAVITGALARYTYNLYRATVKLNAEATRNADEQTKRMERSITEAARAAAAMEKVATATTENATRMPELLRKQMRAYLSIDIGTATYQDAHFRFGASPLITNYGLTPARNVRWHALAAVVDGTNPETTEFPPVGELPQSDIGISPRQSFTLNAVMKDRVPDEEVEAIMAGLTRRLFCWGKVEYEDVYGSSWETKFCLNYAFFRGQDQLVKVSGWVYTRHNAST
jgi:hypothetical protein